MLDNLDTKFNTKLNDKLMTKVPNSGRWKKKSELEVKESGENGEDEEEEGDGEAWEDEYKEFFEAQRKKDHEAAQETKEVQILRNVETTEKVLSASQRQELVSTQQKEREGEVTVRREFKPDDENIRIQQSKLGFMRLGESSPREEGEEEEEKGGEGELPEGIEGLGAESVSDLASLEEGSVHLEDFMPPTLQMM